MSNIVNALRSGDRESIFREDLGIEYHFIMLNRDERPILELETIEEQLDVFNNASEKEQILMLKESLYGEYQDNENILLDLIEAWKRGDTDTISDYIKSYGMKNQPQMQDQLLNKRNINMSEKIRIYLTDKNDYFVIVGVAHLSGKGSILEILSELGFKVEQL